MTTQTKEFLSKEPQKALSDLKDRLYERLEFCRSITELEYPEWLNIHDYASGHWLAFHKAASSDVKWLEETIDMIERS
jgi:hypothetical protein